MSWLAALLAVWVSAGAPVETLRPPEVPLLPAAAITAPQAAAPASAGLEQAGPAGVSAASETPAAARASAAEPARGGEQASVQAAATFDGGRPPSLESLARSMLDGPRHGNVRDGRVALDPRALKPGQRVLVNRLPFIALKRVWKRMPETKEMTVAAVRPRARWQGYAGVVYFKSEQTGQLGLSLDVLRDEVFDPDLRLPASYAPGEFVQIGWDYSGKREFKRTDGRTLAIEASAMPYIGRFAGAREDGYVVDTQSANNGMYGVHLVLSPRDVRSLPAGTRAKARRLVADVLAIPLSFAEGEAVRFRRPQPDGRMSEGTVVRVEDKRIVVRDASGADLSVKRRAVFKSSGHVPARTPRFDGMFDANWAKLGKVRADLAAFLDGGARLTSHPDFPSLREKEKLDLLLRYVDRSVPWLKAARLAENAGLTKMEDILRAGAGTCRHKSVLLAAILAEAGIPARVVVMRPKDGSEGHAWVEADMPSARGVRTWLVDPSAGRFALPLADIPAWVKGQPGNKAAAFYVSPERTYWTP